jgi:hypothetical protein
MKTKHIVLVLLAVAFAAGVYLLITDSWPGRDAGVKNPEVQANQNAKATAPAPPAQSAAETAAAPEQSPPPREDDGRPLFRERESLRVKLEELEKKVKAIPEQRKEAKKETGVGPVTQNFEALMTKAGEDSKNLKEEFTEFDKKFASLPQFQENPAPKNSPPLTGENITLASIISGDMKFWGAPLLALLSLLFILTLAQLWGLRSQAEKLRKDNHKLVLNIQEFGKLGAEGRETLLKKVKAVAEDQLPPIDTRVSDTKDLAESLRDSVNQALERLELLLTLGTDGKKSTDYDEQSSSQHAGQRDDRSRETAKPHSFPVAVADYLNLVKGTSLHLKADQLNDVLVETTEDKGEFVLVKDPPAERIGISYVIPATDYFGTKQDFLNGYYPKYYECSSQLPVGAVRIVRPAKVEKAGSGWRLAGEKGTLEVQQ